MPDRSEKLTKSFLDGLKSEPVRVEIMDTMLPGFGVRVTPNGVKTFYLRYRPKAGGPQRRETLGRFGDITLDEARKRASKLRGQVADGADPTHERRQRRTSSTVADLADRFLSDHVDAHLKPTTARNYRQQIETVIKPKLGKHLAVDLDSGHVAKLIQGFKDRPYQANRILATLSKMFACAETWRVRPQGSNPCRGVAKFKEAKRHRHFTSKELEKIGKALEEAVDKGDATPEGVLALRLLLLTGCRKSEILTLRWEMVDLKARVLNLPDSKTGAKQVILAPAAVRLLSDAAKLKLGPWVCPGRSTDAPLVGLNHMWARVLKRAKVTSARIHDLRHNFGTFGAGSGLSLPLIGGLLGHSQASTTKRYAEVDLDPLRAAAKQTANPIAGALGLKKR